MSGGGGVEPELARRRRAATTRARRRARSAASATPSAAAPRRDSARRRPARRARRPTPAEPTATPATPAEPAAAATATPAQSSTQPPAATPATPSPTPSQQVDAETVKRHLTAARDTLSQLTQLPAAAQLTGDARTQVSQLISNFNELITTNVDWRSSYAKLQANLTALVGDQRADESPTAPATGTAGAVGTSGTVAIDPGDPREARRVPFAPDGIREGGGRQRHAGGAERGGGSHRTGGEHHRSATASTTAAPPDEHGTAAPQHARPPRPTTTSPAPTATTGSTSQTPATAGTSGTGTPMPAAAEQATKPSTSGRDAASSQAAEGHRAAMTHIEAIEAILNGVVAGRHERRHGEQDDDEAWNARPRADRTDPHAPRGAAQGTEQEPLVAIDHIAPSAPDRRAGVTAAGSAVARSAIRLFACTGKISP